MIKLESVKSDFSRYINDSTCLLANEIPCKFYGPVCEGIYHVVKDFMDQRYYCHIDLSLDCSMRKIGQKMYSRRAVR